MDADVAVIGAGVVGSAVTLALARRGASVELFEAEEEPGFGASGTNSGILHTGFDSKPGELETELILRAAELRPPVLEAMGVPHRRAGAVLRPLRDEQRPAVEALAQNAERNGVEAGLRGDGALVVPGETVSDPVAFTLGMVAAAEALGARVRTSARVAGVEGAAEGVMVRTEDGERLEARAAVNCAGLYADEVARSAGDAGIEIYPRKGEFLVYDLPGSERPERILLPVPEAGTKGVLVFPTMDGMTVCGPTAFDGEDKADWSVRPEAAGELREKAAEMHPPLGDAEPVAAYAGLRPAGRGSNYVIAASEACSGLINAAAIRSTGMTASLAIAERVCEIAEREGLELEEEMPLPGVPRATSDGAWWRRSAVYRGEMSP